MGADLDVYNFICKSVLLAMAADSAKDASGRIRDVFRAMLRHSKGAEGPLLWCNIAFHGHQIPVLSCAPKVHLERTVLYVSL